MTVAGKSTAIGILGMHRSGTSTVARAINLLGVYLGEDSKIRGMGPDNPLGFWEHPEICDLQTRLLARLGKTWDITEPLPTGWQQSDAIRPFKDELANLVVENFDGHLLWAWKHPQSCLLLPLWREVLEKNGTKLSCLFVFRNPVDVASSLLQRDSIPFDKAIGMWLLYNLVAVEGIAGLPVAYLNYRRFLENWETELRRCAAVLNLDWPKDEDRFRREINSFVLPSLRHHRATPKQMQELPPPAQELFQALLEACTGSSSRDSRVDETIQQLGRDFHTYASFFKSGFNLPPPNQLTRAWQRWQKSLRKRLRTQGSGS